MGDEVGQIRQVQKAGFDVSAVVADADYGPTAAFRAGLEKWGCATGSPFAGR